MDEEKYLDLDDDRIFDLFNGLGEVCWFVEFLEKFRRIFFT